MMNKLRIKLVVTVVVIMAVTGVGCDDFSPVIRFVQGIQLELYNNYGVPDRLDVWSTDGNGESSGKEEIYGAGFGYLCRVQADGIPLAGIRVECQVVSHHDPLDVGWDVWDEFTPNGDKYGYVRSVPEGDWDRDEGVAVAYTNSEGECVFLIGLGDPDAGFGGEDGGYLWPDYSDGVSSLVEVRFVIRKASGNIVDDCYMVFFRSQYQDFFDPYGGIYGNSFSTLVPWEGWFPGFNKSGSPDPNLGLVGELELDEVELTEKMPYGYSLDKSGGDTSDFIVIYDPNCVFIAGPLVIDLNCPWIVDPNCIWLDIVNPVPDPNCPGWYIDPDCPDYPDPNCPWLYDPNCLVTDPNCYILDPDWPLVPGPLVVDSNCFTYIDPNEGIPDYPDLPTFGEGWEYLDSLWKQWIWGEGWKNSYSMVATWIADHENPDEVMSAMDLSQPYILLLLFAVEEIEDVRVMRHTGIVVAKDSLGRKVSRLPIEMNVFNVSDIFVSLATNFILPMEFPEQQGVYYDRWGNSYAAIYVPEGGHLEVVKDDLYGDFNFDGKVEYKDYGMFVIRWNENVFGLYDPNFAYDLKYDADYDGQTDMSDLMYFTDNWLEIR